MKEVWRICPIAVDSDWEGDVQAAQDMLEEARKQEQKTVEHLERAWESQKKQADKKRKAMEFKVGDDVLLDMRHMRTCWMSKKLDHWRIGPLQVAECIGSRAYRLALPASYKKIHPVFHVSLLEPYLAHKGEMTLECKPMPQIIEGDDDFEVEAIESHRYLNTKLQYYIKWKGYDKSENS